MTDDKVIVDGVEVNFKKEEFHSDEIKTMLTPEMMAKILMATPNLSTQKTNKSCQCKDKIHSYSGKCNLKTDSMSGFCKKCTENGHI